MYRVKSLHIKLLLCSFTYWQSFSNFRNYQIMVSRSTPIKDRSPYTHEWRLLSINKHLINKIMHFLITTRPNVFMDAVMWKHFNVDSYTVYVVKFTTLTPLSLLIPWKLSFPIVCLKIFSVPTFALISHTKIACAASGIDHIHALFPHKSYNLCHRFWSQVTHANSDQ